MSTPVRFLPCGADALLVEITDTDPDRALAGVLALEARLREAAPALEAVPAARTVLVRWPAGKDPAGARRLVAQLAEAADPGSLPEPTRTVTIPVEYAGPDLAEVSRLTGLSEAEVIDAHTGTPWRVAFGGFAPGFAYLVGGDPRLEVPRRPEPRTRVPVGAVGLAGRFSGIYPRESPGGWQLLGTTDASLWDPDREPPALLTPGTEVRFLARGSAGRVKTDPDGRRKETPTPAFEVLATGPLTLFCDDGRPGFANVGVSRSGAADRAAYQLGQRLLGQGYHAAALEVTFGGLVLRAAALAWIALTGAAADATLDGRPVGQGAAFVVAPGQELRLGMPDRGLRTYVSVRGGFEAEPVLGSRATDVLSGLGPPLLRAGDQLSIGPVPAELDFTPVDFAAPTSPPPATPVLDVIRGPRDDWFTEPAGLVDASWEVTSESNRVGVRLSGPVLDRHPDHTGELPSEPMVRGSVQVPPNGQPVVFLADHPVTGGYPVIGVLTPEATDLLAQARPGDPVRFRWFTVAHQALPKPPGD